MIRSWLFRCGVVLVLAGATSGVTAAVVTVVQPPAPQPAPTAAPEPDRAARDQWEREFGLRSYRRPALRVGQDYALRAGEAVGDVVVVFGDARIEGRIRGDLVVVLGNARLGATAIIEGSFVVVGGQADIAPGALVRRDVVTIGADLNAPGDFIFAGEHIVIGNALLGEWLRSVAPWVTTGLLWGRPVVPGIGWVWTVLFCFFVVYLLVNLLLHEPVRATADVLARRPLGTFLVGLLVLLMWAPISALLAVSIVGIIVIPFFLSALFVAAVVGRVGVVRWIGNSLIASDDPSNRVLALRSFVIGFVLLTLVYMVPVLGFVAWGLVGVFGIGAAVMAFLSAWRKETPTVAPPEPRPASPTPPPAAPAPPVAQAAPVAPMVAPMAASQSAPTYGPVVSAPVTGVVRASFLERAAAFGLDVMLVAVLHEGLKGTIFPRYSDFFFPLLVIYFISFWTWRSTTVGGIVMKLKVIKTTGAPVEAADAIVRALAGVLSFVALGVGVLWILKNDDLAADGLPARQGWHDKAVGTWVIKAAE